MLSVLFETELEHNGEQLEVEVNATGNVSAEGLVDDVTINEVVNLGTDCGIKKQRISVSEMTRLMELAEEELKEAYESEETHAYDNFDDLGGSGGFDDSGIITKVDKMGVLDTEVE